MITFDSHEFSTLAADLGKTGVRVTGVMVKVFHEGANDLVKTWAAYARETSGEHGKYYPDSIDAEQIISSDIAFEIGPNPRKPQGGMAFETGSANQPPHPDGQRAADHEVPLLERRIQTALAYLGL